MELQRNMPLGFDKPRLPSSSCSGVTCPEEQGATPAVNATVFAAAPAPIARGLQVFGTATIAKASRAVPGY